MMLYTRNCGMPVLDPLSLFRVKGREFITSPKVIWNRYIAPDHFLDTILIVLFPFRILFVLSSFTFQCFLPRILSAKYLSVLDLAFFLLGSFFVYGMLLVEF